MSRTVRYRERTKNVGLVGCFDERKTTGTGRTVLPLTLTRTHNFIYSRK